MCKVTFHAEKLNRQGAEEEHCEPQASDWFTPQKKSQINKRLTHKYQEEEVHTNMYRGVKQSFRDNSCTRQSWDFGIDQNFQSTQNHKEHEISETVLLI